MSFLRHLAREYLIHRRGGSRHRRRSVWGAPRRRGFLLPAPRRRSRVQVSGCCLPIPLGALALAAAVGTALAGRERR